MAQFIDLTGQKFNRLTVLQRIENNKRGGTRWLCRCDCGKYTEVLGSELRSGGTKSCGCLFLERSKEVNTTHGMNNTVLHKVWKGMRGRCNTKSNSRYQYYGEKGVSICDLWNDKKNGFINFYNWAIQNGYQEGLTIDRIDYNKEYSPDNCRWSDMEIQNVNKGDYVNNTSGCKGVSYHKGHGKWQAYIAVNKKQIYLGLYHDINDAVAARKAAEEKYHKPLLQLP